MFHASETQILSVNHCSFTCQKTQDVSHFSKKFSKKLIVFEKFSKKNMFLEKYSKKYIVFKKFSTKHVSAMPKYAKMTSPMLSCFACRHCWDAGCSPSLHLTTQSCIDVPVSLTFTKFTTGRWEVGVCKRI